MTAPLSIAFLGAGRMGSTHLRNLGALPGVQVRVVADASENAARAGALLARAERHSTDIDAAIHAPDVDAVLIATPTATHADLIEKCVRADKPVWCEKPVAMTLADTQRVLQTVEAEHGRVMIGFMRRFDMGYAAAKRAIGAGELGRIERFNAISCDHNPPPLSFIKTSGGIFVDMLVHDFDMARFLVGEIEEVSAWGGALIDPGYTEAGDVDSCVALLRFANGALGTLEGSRRTTWGYDIRTAVAGSRAKVVIEAVRKTPLVTEGDMRASVDLFDSFPDRFEHAYKAELAYFITCVRENRMPEPGVRDALESLRVALAATKSLHEKRAVRISEIY